MTDWPPDALAAILGGVAVLAVDLLCLTGRYKGWARDARAPLLVLAGLPGLGLILLVSGVARMLDLGQGALGLIGLVGGLTVAALAITSVRPGWWGPRWYREQLGTGRRNAPLPHAGGGRDIGAGPVGHDPSSPLDLAEDGKQPLDRWRATFIVDFDDGSGPDGELLLYREGLAFVGSKPFAQTPFVEKYPPPPGRLDPHVPFLASASVREITKLQLRTELQWRDISGDALKTFQPATPLLWIQMQEDQVLPLTVAYSEQAARRISEVLGCPLEDAR